MSIEQFDAKSKTSDIVAAMDRDGAALMQQQIDSSTTDVLNCELRECFELVQGVDLRATLRSSAILKESQTALKLLSPA